MTFGTTLVQRIHYARSEILRAVLLKMLGYFVGSLHSDLSKVLSDFILTVKELRLFGHEQKGRPRRHSVTSEQTGNSNCRYARRVLTKFIIKQFSTHLATRWCVLIRSISCSSISPIFTKLFMDFEGLPLFCWQLSDVTSCRLAYRINGVQSAGRPHARLSNGGEWQKKLADKIMILHQVRSYSGKGRLVLPPPGSGVQGAANLVEE